MNTPIFPRLDVPLVALLLLSLTCCGGSKSRSKTTDTDSRQFSTLGEKQDFLERYVKFRRHYEELEFDIAYADGGDGRLPAPTEWDIRIFAKVPVDEIDDWIDGLEKAQDVDRDWLAEIPDLPANLGKFEWVAGRGTVVGVDRERQIVVCRYLAF